MRRLFNNVISVIHSAIRFGLLKIFNWNGLSVKLIERFSPNIVFEINRGAKVRLGKMVRAHSGCKFKVRKNAELIIEDGVKINYNCIFVCREKIVVGAGTEFGPSVYIYDHDHDFRAEGGVKAGKFKTAPVKIGNNVWIGANTMILRGTTIGNNCVIGAGSVVSGRIPDNSVLVQKREATILPIDSAKG
ncbi:MAG: acyltransferase [Oscillospiraceae bacterium]|nr:acyltransferase [Oscillospiraceae bacterium]